MLVAVTAAGCTGARPGCSASPRSGCRCGTPTVLRRRRADSGDGDRRLRCRSANRSDTDRPECSLGPLLRQQRARVRSTAHRPRSARPWSSGAQDRCTASRHHLPQPPKGRSRVDRFHSASPVDSGRAGRRTRGVAHRNERDRSRCCRSRSASPSGSESPGRCTHALAHRRRRDRSRPCRSRTSTRRRSPSGPSHTLARCPRQGRSNAGHHHTATPTCSPSHHHHARTRTRAHPRDRSTTGIRSA